MTIRDRIKELMDRIANDSGNRDSTMIRCALRDAYELIAPLMPPSHICPACEASGTAIGLIAGQMHATDCPKCGGLGVVSGDEIRRVQLGEILRLERMALKWPLRKAAEMLGVTPTKMSMAEQGNCTNNEVVELTGKLQRLAARRGGKELKHGMEPQP